MNGIEKIYYSLGEFAYLVASADGAVQNSELDSLHRMVVDELKKHNGAFAYSEVIFSVLDHDRQDRDFVFDSALSELKGASSYLTDDLRHQYISVLKKVAEAFHPTTLGEHDIIEKVERELKKL